MNVPLPLLLLAAWQTLIHRNWNQNHFVVGVSVSGRSISETVDLIGPLQNLIPLQATFEGDPSFEIFLKQVRDALEEAQLHPDAPLEALLPSSAAGMRLDRFPGFDVMFTMQPAAIGELALNGLEARPVHVHNGTARSRLALLMEDSGTELNGVLEYRLDSIEEDIAAGLVRQFEVLLGSIVSNPRHSVSTLSLLTERERETVLVTWNTPGTPAFTACSIAELLEQRCCRAPDSIAFICGVDQLTFQELNKRSSALAGCLRGHQLNKETPVGLLLKPSLDLVIGLLAILKSGAPYVLLNPGWSREQLQNVLADSGSALLLADSVLLDGTGIGTDFRSMDLPVQGSLMTPSLKLLRARMASSSSTEAGLQQAHASDPSASMERLLCIAYDLRSHLDWKGVAITESNALEYFNSMREACGDKPVKKLVSARALEEGTGLQLLWSIASSGTLVLPGEMANSPALTGGLASAGAARSTTRPDCTRRKMDFSLFYFSSQANVTAADRYRLLMEGAKFADGNGFTAVWTPERHFHAFGGLYPNPSVTSAALAMITKRVQLRAGSVVLPLHHPVRVAEEWALVDNLSEGRVGISFASGWHANDFVFAPESYRQRQQILFRDIEVVRRLWRGESIPSLDGAGQQVETRILPRPVQAELPFWVTSSGKPETFRRAGESGGGILTHLLGQSMQELQAKIEVYRAARRKAGHSGPGHVVLMLHTFIGRDASAVRETVRLPFTNYLKDAIDLLQASPGGVEAKNLSPEDLDVVVGFAFDRYFDSSALFGTPDHCRLKAQRLAEIGVDEIACLIDFGADTDSVLGGLTLLNEVRASLSPAHPNPVSITAPSLPVSMAQAILRHQAHQVECHAEDLTALLREPEGPRALSSLQRLVVTGEPPSPTLAAQLREHLSGELLFLNGQPETGFWLAADSIGNGSSTILSGRRLGRAEIYIVDARLQPVPPGVTGELLIGGPGVARGYHERPALTRLHFVSNPFVNRPGAMLFRAGIQARFRSNGSVDCPPRPRGVDDIECLLLQQPGVAEAAAMAVPARDRTTQFIAFVVPSGEQPETTASRTGFQALLEKRSSEAGMPAEIHIVDSLPRLPGGLVNRSALPSLLQRSESTASAFTPPRSSTEEELTRIWREVLGLKLVDVKDDFFDQGGDLRKMLPLLAKVRAAFQVEVSLRELFRSRSIADLAILIEERLRKAAEDPVTSCSTEEIPGCASSITIGLPS